MRGGFHLAAASFVAAVAACAVSYLFLDIPMLRLFQGGEFVTCRRVFEWITRLGVSTPYLVVSALAAVWFRYVKKDRTAFNTALFIFACVAVSGLAADLIKFFAGRYRPVMLLNQNLYGFKFFSVGYLYNSFPSGHANTITALLLSLYIVFRGPGIFYILVAVPVIMSRVIIGVHFFSDTLFGAYLAFVTTFLLSAAFEKHGLTIRTAAVHAKPTWRFLRRKPSSREDKSAPCSK